MKKLILSTLFALLFLFSCKTSQTASGTKIDETKLKGTWQVSSVNYDNGLKIKPFDEGADAQCFVGSQWKLIPNNYSGTYTLYGGNSCPSKVQQIKFDVVDGNIFQFKKVFEGTKAKENVAGYKLKLVSQSDAQFVLEQEVSFEGKMVQVVYTFDKVSTK